MRPTFHMRVALLVVLLLVAIVLTGGLAPIAQDPGYHRFADTGVRLGISNFNDVISNAAFVLVGLLGLFQVTGARSRRLFASASHARPYIVFFAAVVLVGLGSAWYHLAPSTDRLFWDRLPMAVAFMALFSAIVADRIDAQAGNGWLLLVLVVAGIASLVHWRWSEAAGQGDLRYYALVQFYPVLLVPVICWMFPRHRYTPGRYLGLVFLCYGLAKAAEFNDARLFMVSGQLISGHTLKHLAAALSVYQVIRMLQSQVRAPASVRHQVT